MQTSAFQESVLGLPVFDTHTHLNAPGRSLAAGSFADLGHYFWLSQQLQGAGWKMEADADDRLTPQAAASYFHAFRQTEGTAMNWCLRRILRDLYEMAIESPEDILAADQRIRERAANEAEHVREICRRGNLLRITQNLVSQASFPILPELGVLVADTLNGPVEKFLQDPTDEAVSRTVAEINESIDTMAAAGQRGARMDWNLFEDVGEEAWRHDMLDAVFSRLNGHRMFVQIFMGMKRRPQGSFPQDDPRRVTGLIPYFQAYPACKFELVCAAAGNSTDVVQAAVMNPNVYAGGLWWYTFRPSMYLRTMQERLEALSPMKSPMLASDATCMEWCYGKTMLVKTLIAGFLQTKVEDGWMTEEGAVRTASAWLHDAAAAYYL